ncbi:hypothetical protein ABFS82_05G000300 [Erythranthe guttata]|uniref:Bidirectional sugar transporter SWEET n=1 Tax=Erythranthe guttata TaxID=4155 RepID=A0A022RQN9_ERYGU|nr:PREDICTED: bidirectional sugar transporter N3-like [Erythranthe guttata]EYU42078.1 hypothetical protein MIMGU_mgv1a010705mg [Erythranthe guttata]|eukprot:XP_012831633.1 PREDICTED: bidirectional sugar transporter N3-like [Erythranthe guttata]
MAIFDIHHPWAFTFGVLGNIISIFVYLAPLPTFRRIFKEKSTMGFDSLPYAVALFSAMLWLYYAFLKTNAVLLISINTFGCIVETIYISMFLFYASKKARGRTAKLLGVVNVGVLSLIFVVTFFIFKGQNRVHVVGWICVAVSVCVFAAPLSIVFQVVRTRSVEFMPFPLSFFLTLSAVMWFGYGLFEKDLCVAVPNVLGFILGVLQMVLYGIFRNVKAEAINDVDDEKKMGVITTDHDHVINIMVLGTPHKKSSSTSQYDDVTIKAQVSDDDYHENNSSCALSVEPSHVQLDTPPVLVVCAAA